jgi:Mn-dependent DtxR family transcriptional regulator
MNPYIRAAAKHSHIREQLAERASKRPEFAAKPERLQKLKAVMAKPVKPPTRKPKP